MTRVVSPFDARIFFLGTLACQRVMIGRLTSSATAKEWRLRLRAGALAMLFAAFSLLPWFHVLTADGHACHACRPCSGPVGASDSTPGFYAESGEQSDSCWVCQSLITLLQHSEASGSPVFVRTALVTPFYMRVPHAPVIIRYIDPATRSQAPPARS